MISNIETQKCEQMDFLVQYQQQQEEEDEDTSAQDQPPVLLWKSRVTNLFA